ncbi:hypothetical protein EW146_g5024 [Bondarzewia mesenterica]|uniref:thioredoxin-dependent peroxiredoxin n=1 Tax=Bondarzewia mesenterica TaxID=1095465 RepID=A0A4V3XEY6_9AGAM|nr:hypothetical protein EW146_g5024 [Bondarzewia mesenterica]
MVATVQQPAPTFTAQAVVDGLFKEISLSEYLGQWVFLLFYPMDFTFVCPTEILAFNDALPAFANVNTTVLGTSLRYRYFVLLLTAITSLQNRKDGGLGPDLKLPLVADRNMRIARDYGVLIEEKGVALRGLFLIDPKGVLRQATINDLPVGRSVDEALRLVKAFQFTEQYGEVCPANWTEGDRTIKTDPTGKLEYFNSVNDAPAAKRHRAE